MINMDVKFSFITDVLKYSNNIFTSPVKICMNKIILIPFFMVLSSLAQSFYSTKK